MGGTSVSTGTTLILPLLFGLYVSQSVDNSITNLILLMNESVNVYEYKKKSP
jgi:hypothetical protein